MNYMPDLPIPTSEKQFRRYWHGKGAIINNTPTPSIHITCNDEAYILPSDILKIYFSLGILHEHMFITLDKIKPSSGKVDNIFHIKRAWEDIGKLPKENKNTYKLFLAEWNNDFDPNRMSKNNHGSVHVNTFSIFSTKQRNESSLSFLASKSLKVKHNSVGDNNDIICVKIVS